MTYRICNRTVLDTSYPSITFDANGICNHYNDFQNNVLPFWKRGSEGLAGLEAKCVQIKKDGKGAEYDCLVGLSGGVDSSYMLHLMVARFGLRPLVFHVDGGWNSDLSVSNIECLIDSLNLDLFTEVIDWRDMREFQLALFKSGVPYLDAPQDLAFAGVLYQYAKKHNIKWVLNGGNIATESVKYPKEIYYVADLKFYKDILRRFATTPLHNYPFTSIFYRKILAPYFHGIKTFKPLNFIDYNKDEAMSLLKEQYGWSPYPQKHFESRFTRFFEAFWLRKRFGFDVRRVQFSSLILSGQMLRDDALEALEVPTFTQNDVDQEMKFVSDKLQITVDELVGYLKMEKKFFWDYKNSNAIYDLSEKFIAPLLGIRRGGSF